MSPHKDLFTCEKTGLALRGTHLHEPPETRFSRVQVDGHFVPDVPPEHKLTGALDDEPTPGVHAEETGLGDQAHAPYSRLG